MCEFAKKTVKSIENYWIWLRTACIKSEFSGRPKWPAPCQTCQHLPESLPQVSRYCLCHHDHHLALNLCLRNSLSSSSTNQTVTKSSQSKVIWINYKKNLWFYISSRRFGGDQSGDLDSRECPQKLWGLIGGEGPPGLALLLILLWFLILLLLLHLPLLLLLRPKPTSSTSPSGLWGTRIIEVSMQGKHCIRSEILS